MKDEFDLPPYLRVLARQWPWIAVAVCLGIVAGVALAMLQPTSYTSQVKAILRSTQSEVTLDPRYVTKDAVDAANRRRTLLALARSSTIETQMPPDVVKRLAGSKYAFGNLAQRIVVSMDGDLILFAARGSTPEQARDLADTWSTTFISWSNRVYETGGGPTVSSQNVSDRYTAAQSAYEQFLATSNSDQIDQSITSTLGVISAAAKLDQDRYTGYFSSAYALELVLRDAQKLRDEVAAGQRVGPGENLATLLLRARASGGGQAFQFQIQPNQTGVGGQGESTTVADLDAFVKAVAAQIDDRRAAAAEIARALAANGTPPGSSLTDDQRAASYKQLEDLRRQREVEQGKRQSLKQDRDVAFEALQIVRRKTAEDRITGTQSDVVRLVSQALLPERPTPPRLLFLATAGGLAALLMAFCAVILIDLRSMVAVAPRQRASTERPANSPSS